MKFSYFCWRLLKDISRINLNEAFTYKKMEAVYQQTPSRTAGTITMQHRFEITEDGSHTLYVPELDEHYHSTHGAIQESRHVYLDAGLHHCKKDEINVLEIGFGTGLNAFLSLLDSLQTMKKVSYTSLERFPLSLEVAEQLNYSRQISSEYEELFLQLHTCPWEEWASITMQFRLRKLNADAGESDALPSDCYFDVVYFDAFAPEKQPEMWSQEIFNRLFILCNKGGILTTYCAKGVVRRMLQAAGFEVERLPGPPGKREILRAIKPL